MKLLLVLALISFIPPKEKYIDYRKLTYDDFKGTGDGKWAALSSTGILWEVRCNGLNKPCDFRVRSYFDPSKSFMSVKNEKVLRHEQAHFDITELYTRIINEAVAANGYKRSFEIHDSLIVEWNKYQALYDKETDHSRNDSMQLVWENKIHKLLTR
jgi:hypothetical protein